MEKEMATHSSVLAWRIPGTGEPGGLPSLGSHRVRHDWSDLAAAAAGNKNIFMDKRIDFGCQKEGKDWEFGTVLCAKSFQSHPTLCNPMDCSLPGSSIHRISRQKYWSGLPYPSPGDLPDPGIERSSLMSPSLAGGFFTTSATCEAPWN